MVSWVDRNNILWRLNLFEKLFKRCENSIDFEIPLCYYSKASSGKPLVRKFSRGAGSFKTSKKNWKPVDKSSSIWYSYKAVAEKRQQTAKINLKKLLTNMKRYGNLTWLSKQQQRTLITKQWKTLKDSRELFRTKSEDLADVSIERLRTFKQ